MIRNQIFILGGRRDSEFLPTVDMFDVITRKWSKISPLPKALDFPTATVYNRWIIVTGRYTENRKIITHLFVYDTFDQHWNQYMSNVLQKRDSYSCVMVDSNLFFIGGCNGPSEYFPLQSIHISYLIPDWKWESVKHFVLLRKMVDDGRASPAVDKTEVQSDSINLTVNANNVMRKLLTNVSLDVFRFVLSFLIGK